MYAEDELLPISALSHLLFCERRAALVHVEQVWSENHFTIQGQHLHKKAHDGPTEMRDGVRITRGLPLRSLRLGLVGKADVVEFRKARRSGGGRQGNPSPSPSPADRGGGMIVTPVEYKRGRPKRDDSDRVQLCAQALCLEEMLAVTIEQGEIFYGQQRRRVAVEFDAQLRELTENTTAQLHALINSQETPIARYEKKCDSCSLLEICMPRPTGMQRSAAAVVDRHFAAALADD